MRRSAFPRGKNTEKRYRQNAQKVQGEPKAGGLSGSGDSQVAVGTWHESKPIDAAGRPRDGFALEPTSEAAYGLLRLILEKPDKCGLRHKYRMAIIAAGVLRLAMLR
jgi:hypothetical protein